MERRRFGCRDTDEMAAWFAALGDGELAVEATASYECFVQLVERHARRIVLAHPAKLRVIAESTRKSDQLDAQTPAEFLAADMIPAAHRATPRQREHRRLVRYRHHVRGPTLLDDSTMPEWATSPQTHCSPIRRARGMT